MSDTRTDASPTAAGSSGGSPAGAAPLAIDRLDPFRAATCRLFATLPMTMWLTLLLLTGAWTRAVGETALVWIASLPPFLLLDVLRHKAAPNRSAYLAWLGPALAAARRDKAYRTAPGRTSRVLLCYGPLALLVAYIGAFIFAPELRIPELRRPGEALAQMPIMSWAYRSIGAWYPAVAKEPAHILALNHPRDAADLRHFLTVALIFSLGTAFVTAGPGRREFVECWLLRPIRQGAERGRRGWSGRKLFRIAVGQAVLGGIGLAMFAGFGIANSASPGYWSLDAFPPCLMFTLEAWLLSWGIAAVGALDDAASKERAASTQQSPV